MKKMKNIAVVLRGHVRTWHFDAPKVFDFYDQIAENVDYYFITWDKSNTDGIEESFQDQNLIHFQILHWQLQNSEFSGGGLESKWYNGHAGPPFMNMLVLPHLRRREKQLDKKYDCVFDTRPDVLPVRECIIKGDEAGDPIPFLLPEKNSVYVTGLEMQLNMSAQHKDREDIAIQDWFLYMDSEVYDKMIMRYHEDWFVHSLGTGPGTQIELREYISKNRMYLCTNDWVRAYMMRPNVFQLDWLDSQSNDELARSADRWPMLDTDEKLKLCERYSISSADYTDTQSITCKI